MSIVRDRIFRLLQIIAKIQSGRLNVEALATEINVSRRTIFRDVRTLQEAGIPIEFDRERQAYVVAGRSLLPPTNFSPEEVLALLVLCAHVEENSQLPFLEPARSAALKLAAALPPSLGDEIRARNSALAIRIQQTNRLEGHRPIFDDLVDAYRRRLAVRIEYKSPAEADAFQTLLFPYKLLFSVRAWYVIGRSSFHRETRTFHVGRIRKIEPTDRRYSIPPSFSLKRHLRNAWRLIPEPGPDHDVRIRFSPTVAQNVAEVRWHDTQTTQWNADGSLDFRVTTSGLSEISWWVLGYGHHAEVLEPEALRQMVVGQVERLAALYGRPVGTA